jgi:hypothetical protein
MLLLAAITVSAGQVDLATAQQAAQRLLMNKAHNGRLMTTAPAVKWIHQERNSSRTDMVAYYIVNTDRGFVIVSGDDRAQEILGYGDAEIKDMKSLPENMRFWLSYYKQQMEYLQAHPGMVVTKPVFRDGQSVEEMLEARWDQGSPYYGQCPRDGDTRALTGCACTSLAQVFYHWQYPTEPTPVVPGYTTNNGKFTLDALPSVTFDWDNMLPTYRLGHYESVNATAVAQLMRYIGQAERMNYDKAGSDAWEDDIVRACETFGYEDAVAVYKATMNFETGEETTYINDEDWHALMVEELLAGRPFVFCAFDYSNVHNLYSGHAFNVDGYDATDGTFHINWGWSGVGNGNFAMNAFANQGSNYHLGQRIVKNIYPSIAVAPTIKVNPAELEMATRLGEPVTATFTVKGRLLTDDITLTLNDADGVFALDTTAVTMAEAKDGKLITVTYNPNAVGEHTATITLSSPGAEDMVVTLNGTAAPAPLVVYDPVMLPAVEDYISLTSFRADWTDETAAENVASYTLEVSTKPNYVLLDDIDWSRTSESFFPVTENADRYFPDGWSVGGSDFYAEDGFISITGNFYFSTPTYNMAGAEKVTVVFTGKAGYPSATLTVSTSVDSKDIPMTYGSFNQYVVVLNCADADQVTFTPKSGNPGFLNMQIYAGEVPAPQMRATEDGDATWRTITGITDKFYTVTGLTAEGTFLYKVKAFYNDGTESDWSNIEEVTLKDNGPLPHGHEVGDVNHDDKISIKDVTDLINYLLSGDESVICTVCANVNGDDKVSIADVTALIDKLLSNN